MKKSAVRTLEKKVRRAVLEDEKEVGLASYRIFCSLIDKAAKTNVIHFNKASRKKSRLAALIKKKFIITSESSSPKTSVQETSVKEEEEVSSSPDLISSQKGD